MANNSNVIKRTIYTTSQFFDLLEKKSDQWHNRKHNGATVIVLHSCLTGNMEKAKGQPFAQQMSADKELKVVTIIAPDEEIFFDKATMFQPAKEKGSYKCYTDDKGKKYQPLWGIGMYSRMVN